MTLRGLALHTSETSVLIVDRHGDAVNFDWPDAKLLAESILSAARLRAHEHGGSAAIPGQRDSTADQQLNNGHPSGSTSGADG